MEQPIDSWGDSGRTDLPTYLRFSAAEHKLFRVGGSEAQGGQGILLFVSLFAENLEKSVSFHGNSTL